jgi:chromosome segregation ATPase
MQKHINIKRLLKSCDNWKERSNLYQSEKRDMSFKLRDTQNSRNYWKNEYQAVSKELAELKKKFQKVKELVQLIMAE